MLIRDIERCLVNTNLAYNVFFGMHLPIESHPVGVNVLYGPYMALYSAMCENFDGFDKMIQDFFDEKFDMKKEELFPMRLMGMVHGRQELMEHFLMFVENYEELIMELQTRVCLARVDDPDVQYVLEDMPAYFKNVDSCDATFAGVSNAESMAYIIDKDLLYLSDDMIYCDLDATIRLSRFILKSIHHQIDVLYDPDRYRKMEEIRKQEDIIMANNKFVSWTTGEDGVTSYEILSKDVLKFSMPTPKEKAFHTQKHVNKLDEAQGVNLKKPKETVDEKCEYYEKVMAYKYSMTKLVSMLNGIDSDKYASDSKIFGLEVRKIKINSKFKAISKWFDENDYDVNDVRFKARYITYIGTWVVEHIEDLADKCYSFNNDGKFIEYDAKLEYIENASCMLFDLIHKMLEGIPYGDELMYFNDMQVFLKGKKKNAKRAMKKINNMDEQTIILSDRGRLFSRAAQDITADSLLKLAYLAATNSTDCKNVIEFTPGFKFRRRSECESMIAQLGRSIIKESRKNGASEMFKFFLKSNPSIYTRHNTMSDEINVGLCALSYYAFVANDRNITRMVEKMS